MTLTPEEAAKLRAPFEPHQIGKLPKPFSKNAEKGKCKECGGFHGLPAAHLDYVGHAATTDRLLSVDPAWAWKPLAFGPDGLPLLDASGGLWIELTICGITRLGYGDATMGHGMKEIIGDAIRNAAMRFGVALDLWSKEDLTTGDERTEKEKKQDEKDAVDMDALTAQVAGCATLDDLRALWKGWNKIERDKAGRIFGERKAAIEAELAKSAAKDEAEPKQELF